MGWTIVLNSDNKFREEEVDQIVDNLPAKYRVGMGAYGLASKQKWGWSTTVDIYKPEETKLMCGGSYGISGHIAHDFCSYLALKLEENGHTIKKEISL